MTSSQLAQIGKGRRSRRASPERRGRPARSMRRFPACPRLTLALCFPLDEVRSVGGPWSASCKTPTVQVCVQFSISSRWVDSRWMRAVATTLSWQRFALIAAALAAFSWSRLPPVRPGSSGPAGGSGAPGPPEAQQQGMVVELAGFVARLQSLRQGVVRAEISTKAGGTLTWADAIELWCAPSPAARAKYRRPPSSAQLELQERKRPFVPILHARSATSDTLRGILLVRSIAVLPTPCPHHVPCQPLLWASHHGSERVRETPPFLKGGGRRRFEWTCVDAPGLVGTEVRRSEATSTRIRARSAHGALWGGSLLRHLTESPLRRTAAPSTAPAGAAPACGSFRT